MRPPRPRLTARVAPQLAPAAAEPPSGANWIHEIKQDGHRIIAYLDRGKARLMTRNGNTTRRFHRVAELLAKLPVKQAILDGEIAVPDKRGVTNISLLEKALGERGGPLVYYAFDILHLDGKDLGRVPLLARKMALAHALAGAPEQLQFCDHFAGDGRGLFAKVGELGGEGIVCKRADSPYTSGPSSTWLKVKHSWIGTFPVVGYIPAGTYIDALLVAEPGPDLRIVGRIEFYLPGILNRDACAALAFLTRPSPCIPLSKSVRGVCWVEPRLIATVKHFGRTGGGALRAGVLQGLAVE